MEKQYEEPKMEVITFSSEDIITNSLIELPGDDF